MMMQIVLKKNRAYQCLIMDAYEKFEDAIENIYAYLGKNDINFWPLHEYGNKKYNEINTLDFSFYLSQAEKRKNGAIGIAKLLIDRFNQNIESDGITLKNKLIVVEKIRHIIVHKGGIVEDKGKFIELISKECGLHNNGVSNKTLKIYIEYFFGGGEYSNMINLIEEQVKIPVPILVERSRFEWLLNSMLNCVFILCQESEEYIETINNSTDVISR